MTFWLRLAQKDLEEAGLRRLRTRGAAAWGRMASVAAAFAFSGVLGVAFCKGAATRRARRAAAAARSKKEGQWELNDDIRNASDQEETWRLETSARKFSTCPIFLERGRGWGLGLG